MENPIHELRTSDFVIFEGNCATKDGGTRAYSFAKIDSRCNLMNNSAFISALKAGGAKVITK
jgi:hypothetical protein